MPEEKKVSKHNMYWLWKGVWECCTWLDRDVNKNEQQNC